MSTINQIEWATGTPEIPAGARRSFWCAYRTRRGGDKIYHRVLVYGNAHVMPLSDSCDREPECAVPVGDDGDYAWTGWFEPSCDQCKTQWTFGDEVVAWMSLPLFNPHAR